MRAFARSGSAVQAARERLAAAQASVAEAERRQQLALATVAALLGDDAAAAATVGVETAVVSKARKTVAPTEVRAECSRLVDKARPGHHDDARSRGDG